MKGCLSNVHYSILINGRPCRKFKGTRGLRQGDPLSPFLFTLVADGLSRMLEVSIQLEAFKDLVIGRDRVKVSYLQFVNDTLSFLNQILKIFSMVSGLKINMGKSTFLGINLDEDFIFYLAANMGCSVGSWPIKYLGLPLGGNP